MSTRYVWNKYNVFQALNPSSVSQYSWYAYGAGTANHIVGYCATSIVRNDTDGTVTLSGTVVALTHGGTVSANTYRYFAPVRTNAYFYAYHPSTQIGEYWFGSADGSNNDYLYLTASATSSATKYQYTLYTRQSMRGDLIGSVSANTSSAYPTTSGGAVSGNYWYTYQGSDSIDPISVNYPTEGFRPGDKITVSVGKSSSIKYGGTISYLYQYQLNGGSWTNIQTTSAESISFTVPSNAKTIRFRVRAQDDMGFVSTTYVTGDTAGVERLNLWVGINGKAKKGEELYVGVNGKARKVVAAWIGVNGKARRFL